MAATGINPLVGNHGPYLSSQARGVALLLTKTYITVSERGLRLTMVSHRKYIKRKKVKEKRIEVEGDYGVLKSCSTR